MYLCKTAIFCCLLVCWNIAALADKEEASEEVLDGQDLKRGNETSSSAEAGPPDSHEAMNNRDAIPKIREKRSYEFLMGLINNNSRYEVTRVDPTVATEKTKTPNESKLAASELLLELMVRIASHPQQWEKVHKLLLKLDRDLTTSRSIVSKLQTNPGLRLRYSESEDSKDDIYVNKKEIVHSEADAANFTQKQETKAVFDRRKNDTKPVYDKELKWPTFDDQGPESNVNFVNSTKNADNASATVPDSQKYQWQVQNKSTKVTYPKNFSYHRVTGKPIYLNKTPKAYIAVSIVAQKPPDEDTKENDDVTLENELHQLKPWARGENLKNGASLRSKWVIRTDENREKSVVPTL